jgi:hypothetical protein
MFNYLDFNFLLQIPIWDVPYLSAANLFMKARLQIKKMLKLTFLSTNNTFFALS